MRVFPLGFGASGLGGVFGSVPEEQLIAAVRRFEVIHSWN